VDSREILRLHEKLQDLERNGGTSTVLEGRAADWYEVFLFPGATDDQIADAEALLGRKLPDEFAAFLRCTNGANLFLNESGLHGIGVASLSLLPQLQIEEAEVYGGVALTPYLVFARVNGAGDFLAFELNTGGVLDCVHAERPTEWRVIAPSFCDWLARLIESRGSYYWIEELYQHAAVPIGAMSAPLPS
jgi:hypothetical protein